MEIKPELLDELLSDCKTPGDVDSLYAQLLQKMINRSLEAEMAAHLGYDSGEKTAQSGNRSNTRNGKSKRTQEGQVSTSDKSSIALWP